MISYYIVSKDDPFRGYVHSAVGTDGIVFYTDGEKVEDYLARKEAEGQCLKVISEAELDRLLGEYYDSLKTAPREVDREAYEYALNVLPPAGWRDYCGYEAFYVPEYITASLVDWYVKKGDKFYTFVDCCSLSGEGMREKMKGVQA